MFNIDELLQQIKNLKLRNKKIFSSTLLLNNQLTELANADESILRYGNDFIIILEPFETFYRMYYYISGLEGYSEINSALKELAIQKDIIVEVVGKTERLGEHKDGLLENGFVTYTHFTKWKGYNKTTDRMKPSFMDEIEIKYAEKEHAGLLANIIKEGFDVYVSQLPDEEEIKDLIDKNLVYCAWIGGSIAGVFCVKDIGRKEKHLHINVAVGEYKKLGLGFILFQHVIDQYPPETVFTSFTDDNNKATNRIHKFFKFERQNMGYYVMHYGELKGEK